MTQIKLHANARTTPKTREYIQKSSLSVIQLAKELGISERTVRHWKDRTDIYDRSHCRHNLLASMTHEEEEVIVELRQIVRLSLDDLVEVVNRCVNPNLKRSSIYRCLKRRGVAKLAPLEERKTSKPFEATEFGYVHIDLKHLTRLQGHPSYVFVAIERTTRFVYVEVVNRRDAATITACLERFLNIFPGKVHTILTDNGSEFTDRFAVCKIGKEFDKPSGGHSFDLICQKNKITHKLTRSFSPQTNGMVERFNRRLSEIIAAKAAIRRNQGKNKFASHQERNQFIMTFVENYNRTRLRCLDYETPLQKLHNHTVLNTKAGIQTNNPFLFLGPYYDYFS